MNGPGFGSGRSSFAARPGSGSSQFAAQPGSGALAGKQSPQAYAHPMRIRQRHSLLRLIVMLIVGVSALVATGLLGHWQIAPVIGWAFAAATFSLWVWIAVGRLNAASTKSHATREEPAREVADLLILLLEIASLGSLALVLIPAASAHGIERVGLAALGLLSIALSWILLHTLFTLRYARLYYGGDDEGGIEFNQKAAPTYGDFVYFAFTVGMTFQVSDTTITDHAVRATTLRHALLSFVFGSVILAATVNLIAGLGG
jgi:uncharacterized membrane protein